MAKQVTMASVAHVSPTASVDFDALYRAHAAQVRAVACQRLADRAQADDVVQETFLRAYRAIDRLDPDRPPWPWLRRIAENICTDLLRRTAVVSELPVAHNGGERHPAGDIDPSADAYIGAQRRAGIRDALGQIHPRQRRLLMLQAVEGWTPGAVAEAEGMSVSAVRATLKRGRQSFRRHYLALAAERGLLGVLAAVAWLRLKAARTQRQVARLGEWSVEAALPAGFVSMAIVVGAVSNHVVADAPAASVLRQSPRTYEPVMAAAETASASAETAAVAEPATAEGGAPSGREHSVATAPGPVGVAATAGVEKEQDDRLRMGVHQRLPVHERETEVWWTIPCTGSITGSVVCRAVRTIPDE